MTETLAITATFCELQRLSVDFDAGGWTGAVPHSIDRLWNGLPAPAELATTARMIWNREALIFGFECRYTELDIDSDFDPTLERYGLWDLDVCEAFVRSPIEPHEKHYREFEVAPTGQWCDLIVDRASMTADWQWRSGMRTLAVIDESEKIWRAVMAIPFTAFDCVPAPGDIWHGNLFRISRLDGERQYLAYSPTLTEIPNYHVAEKFVPIRFQ
ncbi:MAG: carbohydrate-binding family 9-like protein [Acidobacteriota bacterium]|nr:MAG: carbohydrate-binding family 9-like protein [Acidobacteriota bacterium]